MEIPSEIEYKNKKTSWIVYVLAVIFILKYIYV